MPRVLIVSLHFPPDSSVGAKRVLRMASHLPEWGWETTVLTVRPGYYDRQDSSLLDGPTPFGAIRTHALTPLRWARFLRDRYLWRSSPASAGLSGPPAGDPALPNEIVDSPAPFWRRLVATPDEYVGWIPVAIGAGILGRSRPDVVLASGPPFSAHLAAAGIARLLRTPLALDYRDPWTLVPGDPVSGSRRSLTRHLEAWCVRQASLVITTTGAIARSIDKLVPVRTQVIPNAIESAAVAGIPPSRDARFSIVHAGNFYGSRSPEPLLRAIRLLRDRNGLPARGIVLRAFGATGEVVTKSAATLGVDQFVEAGGLLPHREALARIRGADVLLLVVGTAHAGMVPAKLFEYLAARRYILTIGPRDCEAGRIVTEAGAGDVVAPEDVEGIARILLGRIVATRDDLPEPAILQTYSVRRTMGDLDQCLRSLLRDPSSTPCPPGSPRP